MRKLVVIGLLAATLAALLAAGPALSARRTVEVDDNYFVKRSAPHRVTVQRNDTVVWRWEGSNPHNVTVDRGPVTFRSRTKTSGTYRKRMRRAGIYRIICTIHAPSMRMRLRVVR